MRLARRLRDALRHPRRLAAFIQRTLFLASRGEIRNVVQRLRPRGPSVAEAAHWSSHQPLLAPSCASMTFVVALDFGEAAARALVATFAKSANASPQWLVRAATGRWAPLAGGQARPLVDWMRESSATWAWWIAAPLTLAPDAAESIALGCEMPQARLVYADHAVLDPQGNARLALKPAWDRVMARDRPYASPVLAVHATLASKIDSIVEHGIPGQWRLLCDLENGLAERSIVHVPRIVARLTWPYAGNEWPRRQASETDVSVSIVIPTRDGYTLLERCVRSVVAGRLPRDGEVVIVDNGSSDPRIAALSSGSFGCADLHVVAAPGPFNFPKLCNAGARVARGRVIVLLNNDTQVSPGWVAELVDLAIQEGVGAVGPLLLYPDGVLQSAGVLLGVNRTATSALAGFAADDDVARQWCAARRRVSAVLGACLAVEREKYLAVSGMDEAFGVSHNEVDFCLRLEAAGYANVFTPFARVVHDEGGTRGFEVTREERLRLSEEEALFVARWGSTLATTDPAHHPAFNRQGNPFALDAAAADRLLPRAGWRAVTPSLPVTGG